MNHCLMKAFCKHIAVLVLMALATFSQAQENDTITKNEPLKTIDSCVIQAIKIAQQIDSLKGQVESYQAENQRLQNEIERMTQQLDFYQEKETFYKDQALKDIREANEQLRCEKDKYQHLSDSLRNRLIETEKSIIRTNEELKYTQQRARDAEAKISAATAKKKKVCAIQGIALKTFRTPNWSIAPDKIEDGSIAYRIVNKNGGEVEFDYTAGAYVMLWDLTKKHTTDSITRLHIKRFDQEFSYSLGLYVGFGGSNLFKNFYVGPSFKFLDFFHLSAGINVCEYEMLTGNFKEGDILPVGLSLTDQISKVWKPKPFFSLSFDLDFISYIKK